jgi:hypothetical protein
MPAPAASHPYERLSPDVVIDAARPWGMPATADPGTEQL